MPAGKCRKETSFPKMILFPGLGAPNSLILPGTARPSFLLGGALP